MKAIKRTRADAKVPREYAELAKAARQQGWRIVWTRNNHLCWVNPQGRSTYTPSTPSARGGGGILPVIRKLEAAGLKFAGRGGHSKIR